MLLQLVPISAALTRLPWLPLTVPVPAMPPTVEVRLTVLPDTGPATLIVPVLNV